MTIDICPENAMLEEQEVRLSPIRFKVGRFQWNGLEPAIVLRFQPFPPRPSRLLVDEHCSVD